MIPSFHPYYLRIKKWKYNYTGWNSFTIRIYLYRRHFLLIYSCYLTIINIRYGLWRHILSYATGHFMQLELHVLKGCDVNCIRRNSLSIYCTQPKRWYPLKIGTYLYNFTLGFLLFLVSNQNHMLCYILPY